MQTGVVCGISGRHVWIEMLKPVDTHVGEKVDLKKHVEKRSLNANNYFHKLCDELRQKLRISFATCKNMLITSYGQLDYLDEVRRIWIVVYFADVRTQSRIT